MARTLGKQRQSAFWKSSSLQPLSVACFSLTEQKQDNCPFQLPRPLTPEHSWARAMFNTARPPPKTCRLSMSPGDSPDSSKQSWLWTGLCIQTRVSQPACLQLSLAGSAPSAPLGSSVLLQRLDSSPQFFTLCD